MPLALDLNKSLVLFAYLEAGSAVEANVLIVGFVFLCRGGANVAVWTCMTLLQYSTDSASVRASFQWNIFTQQAVCYFWPIASLKALSEPTSFKRIDAFFFNGIVNCVDKILHHLCCLGLGSQRKG